MELVYADRNQRDIGVIKDYEFELSYGEKENDFSFSLPLSAHCCLEGYYLYVEGTEYGGIVDTIVVDTSKETVTYSGRTWQGILAHAIIEPDASFDYYIIEGDGNECLKTIIERTQLQDIFEAPDETSEVYIGSYQFDRYVDAYTGINKMLREFGGRLKLTHKGKRVIAEAVYLIDYTKEQNWDSSQIDFKLTRAFHPTNHLICLGSGSLANRHVIHLFTDENGGVYPWVNTSNPMENKDYILDKRYQQIFGKDEVCEVYDYPSAQTAENYILLTEEPDRWYETYGNYFVQQDEEYSAVTSEERTSSDYVLLTSQPSDWVSAYSNYYTLADGKYSNVKAVVTDATTAYRKLNKKPSDWSKNYKTYYYYFTDGVTVTYKQVSGDTKYKYKMQTKKPSDWNERYTSYYQTKKKGGYEAIPRVAQGKKIPKWKTKTYYTRESYSVAPNWDKEVKAGRKYYTKYVATERTESAPTWQTNTYYRYQQTTTIVIPAWAQFTYYRKAYDDYAELVIGGIQRLEEAWATDSLDVNIDNTQDYFIGDLIGATEVTTNLNVTRYISQKIVSIKSDFVTIKYKLGGK